MHMRTKSITIHHVTLRYRIPIMSNLNQKQHSLSDNEARQDRFLTQVAYFIVHGPVLWELNGSGSPNFSFQKLWRLPCSTSKYIENCSVYMDNCQYIPLLIHSSLTCKALESSVILLSRYHQSGACQSRTQSEA
jgi:hypothetical protein